MSADGGRHYVWQNDHFGQESIPLRDHSPSGRTLQTPPKAGRRSSGGEGRWNQKDGAPTWAAQSHPREPLEGISASAKQRLTHDGLAGEVKKHSLALWLILLYAFIAILAWTITCVLCYQPIGIPTYFDQAGNYSRSRYETTDNWRKASSVGLSILGVISIPVTSAICAKAAAVYCQRCSDAKAPSLSLRQMLALADKGWSDSATLLDVVRPSTSRRTRSPLLILSTGLVAIGKWRRLTCFAELTEHGLTAFMIPIIQTSLMGTEHIRVLSAQDVIFATFLGFQVTPQNLVSLSNTSVMDNVISSTITGKLGDKQPSLWSFDQDNFGITSVDANISNSSSFNDLPKEQFIAAFPVGTNTGVLRDLTLRLNVSVTCTLVPQSDFPSTCPGAYPLSETFSNINISTSTPFGDLTHPRYRARICASGNTGVSPRKNTADRQDISEEFWLDYQRTPQPSDGGVWGITDGGSNYTQHCYGNSTLGYFELPNYWNGNVAGPLLDKVPPNGPNLTYWNGDPQELTADVPGETEADDSGMGVPGPFLTAIMAIFGPNTFFNTAAANSNWTSKYTTQSVCTQLRYPFTSLSSYSSPGAGDFTIDWTPSNAQLTCPSTDPSDDPAPPLLRALMSWLPNFGDANNTIAALTLTTYAAANAILNVGPDLYTTTGYFLSTSPGTDIQKPSISLAGIVVVSLLLAIQIIGLMLLAIYASRRATWTESLDAWVMLRLGAEIGREELPAVSALEAKEAEVLDEQKGWVGDTRFEGREGDIDVGELGLGGRGRVREGVMYRMVRKKESGGDGL